MYESHVLHRMTAIMYTTVSSLISIAAGRTCVEPALDCTKPNMMPYLAAFRLQLRSSRLDYPLIIFEFEYEYNLSAFPPRGRGLVGSAKEIEMSLVRYSSQSSVVSRRLDHEHNPYITGDVPSSSSPPRCRASQLCLHSLKYPHISKEPTNINKSMMIRFDSIS